MDTKSNSFAYVGAPFKTSHTQPSTAPVKVVVRVPLAVKEEMEEDENGGGTLDKQLAAEGKNLANLTKARLFSRNGKTSQAFSSVSSNGNGKRVLSREDEKVPMSFKEAIAAGPDNNVKALDTIRLDTRAVLRGHLSKIYALQWANDSRSVVSASQDGKMIVWDAHKAFKLFLIPLESAWVMTCAFSPSNSLVACGGLDNACTIYSLRNLDGTARLHRCLHDAHDAFVSCVRFVSEGRLLTASGDKTIGYWDVERRVQLASFAEHTGGVMAVALPKELGGTGAAAEDAIFLSGACDATAKLWDLRLASQVVPNGGSGKKEKACVATYSGHRDDINDLKFFPSGHAFATGSDDGTCRLFDLRTGTQLAAYSSTGHYTHPSSAVGSSSCAAGVEDPAEITSVDFSSSGRLLFAGDNQLKCTVWDTVREERVGVLAGHSQRVSCLGVAGDGSAVCTGSWDGLLRVWN